MKELDYYQGLAVVAVVGIGFVAAAAVVADIDAAVVVAAPVARGIAVAVAGAAEAAVEIVAAAVATVSVAAAGQMVLVIDVVVEENKKKIDENKNGKQDQWQKGYKKAGQMWVHQGC